MYLVLFIHSLTHSMFINRMNEEKEKKHININFPRINIESTGKVNAIIN